MSRTKPPQSIIDGHPLMVAWQEEGVKLEAQRVSLLQQVERAAAERDAAEVDLQARVMEALANGTDVPRQPRVVDTEPLDRAWSIWSAADADHRARKQRVIAQIAGEGGVAAARERVRVVSVNARDAVRAVLAARADVAEALRVLSALIGADEMVNQGHENSRPAAALAVRAGSLTLDDFAQCVIEDLPVENATVDSSELISRVSVRDDDDASISELKMLVHRQANAGPQLGLSIHRDSLGAFAAASPNQAGAPRHLGRRPLE